MVEADTNLIKVSPVPGKATTEYIAFGVGQFVYVVHHIKFVIRTEGEPPLISITNRVTGMWPDRITTHRCPKHVAVGQMVMQSERLVQ